MTSWNSIACVAACLAWTLTAAPLAAGGLEGQYVEARTCQVYTGPCFANSEINLAGKDAQQKIDRFAEQIKGIGPASIIMASDLGQKANALPPEGFAVFIDAMRKKGFTDQELDLMTRKNPATLLGLK